MNSSNACKKIIDLGEYRSYKKIDNEIIGNELEEFDRMWRKMREVLFINQQETLDFRAKRRIMELEKEKVIMANKLRKSFPTHIIFYLSICSFVIGISITLLFITYVCDVYLIDPYYIICMFLISLTLFCTTVASIKDWKEYINGK